ncbi:winged helix-turn-helix domain-containing protein [Novilysobacter erysipheiresistens]|uniref:Winged helix-turn-helix domain-containing protein n=1 Tax=Novilysobacter erysipheiresistens TaxID=1749332 RepID=A0ABU7Z1U3_9GAMM
MTIARYRFGSHTLDLARRELRCEDRPVALQARVFECLCCLIEHRDRAVGRDELVGAVFGRADVSDAQLAQIILRTRRAVGDDGQKQHTIRTVPRFGFRWTAAIAEEFAEAAAVAESDSDVAAAQVTHRDLAATNPAAARKPARPSPAPPLERVLRPALLGAAFALLAGLLTWWVPHASVRIGGTQSRADAAVPRGAIMVLPTDVTGAGDVAWARLGLMDYLADRLRRASLPVLASETTLGVLRKNPGLASDTTALREATRTAWVVTSQATQEQDRWAVSLVATDVHGVAQRGHGVHQDLLDATRAAGDRLLAALGGHLPPATEAETDPGLAERLQRAQSAMLANELDTARRILNEAPELQRSQPQLRYRLSQVDFRAGEYERGLASLDELLEMPGLQADPLFHARLLNARGAMLIRLDRYAEAERSYDRAVRLLDGGKYPAELGRALNARAVTRSSQGRFAQALADLGTARVQLVRAGDGLAVARVDANLGNVEMDRDRPAQAVGYFDKAADDFASMGAVNELAAMSGMLMTARLQLLQPARALQESERAWALRERIRDPAQRANLLLGRAEVLIATGQLSEARELLQRPEAGTVVPGDFRRREFLQMELAWHAGDPRSAALLAEEALREWPQRMRPRLRAWTRLRRQQASLRADLPLPDAGVANSGDSLPEVLIRAVTQRVRGDEQAADSSYRAALALAEQRGIAAEIAEVVDAHATWLLERSRLDDAGALVGRVAPWAERDFDLALLQARLFQKLGQHDPWQRALENARRLAGERNIPAELTLVAPSPTMPTHPEEVASH